MFLRILFLSFCASVLFGSAVSLADVKTWDSRHSIEDISLRVVYFVPSDREPLTDWYDRANYYCRRIEQFHQREYGGQSTLSARLEVTPFVSSRTTAQLRAGDADSIFFKTLREVDERLNFGKDDASAFPILLVLSEINWKPLDDFYRLKPGKEGPLFEGNYSQSQHFPGAESGGARATYLADQRKGWGLVSADGWRVPYRGSDCVAYHEGVGHTVGLPHPQPGNGSVMSLGQYQGWLSESWLDKEQKLHMGWDPEMHSRVVLTPQQKLFTEFRAVPAPLVPKPGETATLKLDWPEHARVQRLSVRMQTELHGPWVDVTADSQVEQDSPPDTVVLGKFDRPTPVSYRVQTTLMDGSTEELWGYFQVRANDKELPRPTQPALDLTVAAGQAAVVPSQEVDVLAQIDLQQAWQQGAWTKDESGTLLSPKGYGMRLQLPGDVPRQYRMVVVVEPLDEPNGLLLGSRMGESRFATLINYSPEQVGMSALENVEGRNVGNSTTVRRDLFRKNRLSQVVVTVLEKNVHVTVDGATIIDWQGDPSQLSLGDYWATPDQQKLFLGAYDCRYRFYRIGLSEIE